MKKNNQAFTLVEIVVVAGIMALFSLTLVSVFLATVRGGSKSQLTQAVHQEGDFAVKRIASIIRAAGQVSCSGSRLTVTPAWGPDISFSLVNNNGVVRVASDSSRFLTGTVSTATGLDFDCYPSLLGNQVVTITLDLEALPPGGGQGQVQEQAEQSFATSVSTRQY